MSLTSDFAIKILAAILVFSVSLLAGLYPFVKRYRLRFAPEKTLAFPSAEALSAGVFLGAGLIHMLGDAAQDFIHLNVSYPIAFLLAGGMFILLLWFEHLTTDLQAHKQANHPVFAILALIMLSIHSFLAGAALGLGSSLAVILLILIAILAHKWAASFALAVKLNQSRFGTRATVLLFILFSVMTPLGICFGALITSDLKSVPVVVPIFTALSAGTFLYLGTLHGLARATLIKDCCNLRQFTWFILGFAMMALVAVWT